MMKGNPLEVCTPEGWWLHDFWNHMLYLIAFSTSYVYIYLIVVNGLPWTVMYWLPNKKPCPAKAIVGACLFTVHLSSVCSSVGEKWAHIR